MISAYRRSRVEQEMRLLQQAISGPGIDFHGEHKHPMYGTVLFQIVQGGNVSHWVSANNHVEALVLLAAGDHLDGHPADDSIEIFMVPRKDAETIRFYDQDSNERRSMWDEWQRDASVRYVASSEW